LLSQTPSSLLPNHSSSDSYILDNACGTGIVTSLIKSQHPSTRILGTDLSPGMIETFKAKAQNDGCENVEGSVLDSRDLEGLEDGAFSHVITNFGFMPGTEDKSGPEKTAKEIWRVLGTRGVTVVTTWAVLLPFSFSYSYHFSPWRNNPTRQ
jgi:ubiquinone/menaquinone biosynthesis C-methylase UbiE